MKIHGVCTVCSGAQGAPAVTVGTMPDGKEVVSFNVSMSNGRDKKTGNWNKATFFKVSCFGYAAASAKSLEAKNSIFLDGILRQEFWTDRQGIEKSTMKITADSIYRLIRSDIAENEVPTQKKEMPAQPSKRGPVQPPIQFADEEDSDFPDLTNAEFGDVPF